MLYVIAQDSLDHDYHPDRLVCTYENHELQKAKSWCNNKNTGCTKSDQYFYIVITNLSDMNLLSMYDCNGDIPTLEQFLNYSGLRNIPNIEEFYKYHFQLS